MTMMMIASNGPCGNAILTVALISLLCYIQPTHDWRPFFPYLISSSPKWRDEVSSTSRPFRFIHYDPIIQRKQKEFQDERQQRSKLNDDLSEIQNIMKKNINDILDRGEKLDNVQNISQDLLKQSSGFKWGARKLTLQARLQQYLPMVVIGLIVCGVVYVKFFW